MGFIENDCDPCILIRRHQGVRTTVIIYVDDVMITSRFKSHITAVILELEKRYDKLKVSTGPIHSFLGMVFDFTMKEYVAIN